LEQVLKRVFAAANRDEFCKWFSRDLGQRINRNHAMYLRQFLQLLKEWCAMGEPVLSPEPHYVEFVVADVFGRNILPVIHSKKKPYCLKRLEVAANAIDDLLFE
jgi:hypothetical protein